MDREFQLLNEIRHKQVIANGRGVRDRRRLIRDYGGTVWKKMKGIATIRFSDGTIVEAELHWYEAHGIGKRDLKYKKVLR